ncbi:MAG TPA: transposase [bacterium]|nr:transposase [bacterium]
MSTYTQIYYHVIFSTKDRRPVLTKDRREELFRYIWGVIKNHQCHLYRLNGVDRRNVTPILVRFRNRFRLRQRLRSGFSLPTF